MLSFQPFSTPRSLALIPVYLAIALLLVAGGCSSSAGLVEMLGELNEVERSASSADTLAARQVPSDEQPSHTTDAVPGIRSSDTLMIPEGSVAVPRLPAQQTTLDVQAEAFHWQWINAKQFRFRVPGNWSPPSNSARSAWTRAVRGAHGDAELRVVVSIWDRARFEEHDRWAALRRADAGRPVGPYLDGAWGAPVEGRLVEWNTTAANLGIWMSAGPDPVTAVQAFWPLGEGDRLMTFSADAAAEDWEAVEELAMAVLESIAPRQFGTEGPLAGRLQTSVVDLSPESLYSFDGVAVMLTPTDDGGAWLTWQDDDRTSRTLRIDASHEPVGEAVRYGDRTVWDVVTHEDGFAVLLSDNWREDNTVGALPRRNLYLARYDENGRKLFERQLPENGEVDRPGTFRYTAAASNYMLGYVNQQRLLWTGSRYAVYASMIGHLGEQGVHQSELLLILDEDGNVIELAPRPLRFDLSPTVPSEDGYAGGFLWGMSHSFGKRLLYDGHRLLLLGEGDSNPRGLTLTTRVPVAEADQGPPHITPIFHISGQLTHELDNYLVHTALGQAHLTERGVRLAFRSAVGRPTEYPASDPRMRNADLALMEISPEARVLQHAWLTETPATYEDHPKLARYGESLLLLWSAFEDRARVGAFQDYTTHTDRYALISPEGELISGPHPLRTRFYDALWEHGSFAEYGGSELVRFADGDLRWARGLPGTGQIEILKITAP